MRERGRLDDDFVRDRKRARGGKESNDTLGVQRYDSMRCTNLINVGTAMTSVTKVDSHHVEFFGFTAKGHRHQLLGE